eukprot:4005340-Karenia_brevis.AAC.1
MSRSTSMTPTRPWNSVSSSSRHLAFAYPRRMLHCYSKLCMEEYRLAHYNNHGYDPFGRRHFNTTLMQLMYV